MQSLTIQRLSRPGHSGAGATMIARTSADFVVDGASLLLLLTKEDGSPPDFMGCFVHGLGEHNAKKLAQLSAASAPDTEEGRYLLYICPECGDIGCGAYAAKIRFDERTVEWYDFAYENGYEPGRTLPAVGPFRFSRSEYKAALSEASAA